MHVTFSGIQCYTPNGFFIEANLFECLRTEGDHMFCIVGFNIIPGF